MVNFVGQNYVIIRIWGILFDRSKYLKDFVHGNIGCKFCPGAATKNATPGPLTGIEPAALPLQ